MFGFRRKREAAARERFPQAKLIITNAHFFGQESQGKTQMRGLGTLVLTETELFFERWLPRREYHIPLSAIQAIETPKSFLGKTTFTKLLKVVFLNESGETDAIAWQVQDLEAVKSQIEAQRH